MSKVTMVLAFDCLCSISSRFFFSNSIINHHSRFDIARQHSTGKTGNVPGILYANVGKLAGFFVFLTMSVFVLLTLKYAEVTQRYSQGGGVVTVAALAINKWVCALEGK